MLTGYIILILAYLLLRHGIDVVENSATQIKFITHIC
jgi:hypothetical protein